MQENIQGFVSRKRYFTYYLNLVTLYYSLVLQNIVANLQFLFEKGEEVAEEEVASYNFLRTICFQKPNTHFIIILFRSHSFSYRWRK